MKNKIYLHEDNVQAALSAIHQGESLKDHPLCYFLSVRTLVENPHILSGDIAVFIAIRQHLVNTIVERLADIRLLYGIPVPNATCADFHLLDDFEQDNVELEAWSVLYHRYVCIDRDISLQTITDHTGVPRRTLNRRHALGITRLTIILIEHEQNLSREYTRKKLLLALPHRHVPPLIGVKSQIETAYHILTESEPPYHLVLHGPTGIGKTTLALALARRLVEEDILSDLLWIDMSASNLSHFVEELTTRLAIHRQNDVPLATALKAYLFAHPTLIILDGAEAFVTDAVLCERVLNMLDSARLLLTSRVLPDVCIWSYHLTLPELKRDQAFDYLDSVARRLNIQGCDRLDEYDAIWHLAGGNPLLLETLFGASMSMPLDEALLKTTAVFEQIWYQLNEVERKLWLLPLLCFQDGIPYESVRDLSGLARREVNWGINALVSRALLYPQPVSGTVYYTMQAAARVFMLERLGDLWIDGQLRAYDFLQSVVEWYVPQVEAAVHGLCLLNVSLDLEFPIANCHRHAQTLAPLVTQAGLWPAWAETLGRLQTASSVDEHTAWLSYLSGIAQRWLGNFDNSCQQLEQARIYYAASHDEIRCADCLVELSVVYRYQAFWEEAHRFASRALAVYQQHQMVEGIERTINELAQLALERREAAHAINRLEELAQWSARTWGIAGQAYMQLDQYRQASDAIQQALDLQPLTHPNRGRAMATLGQLQHALGQPELAAITLTTAMKLLDDSKDIVGYARVCNNLAVAYFEQTPSTRQFEVDEIQAKLLQAAHIQEHIGDEIGLTVTRQNIECFFPGAT